MGIIIPSLTFLCSCERKNTLVEEEDAFLSQSISPIGIKYDNFYYKNKMTFKERRTNGIDVYSLKDSHSIDDGVGTLFYFKDGINVGYRTSNPEYGFTIFGNQIGSSFWESFNKTITKRHGWSLDITKGAQDGHPGYEIIRNEEEHLNYIWWLCKYDNNDNFQMNVTANYDGLVGDAITDINPIGHFEVILIK